MALEAFSNWKKLSMLFVRVLVGVLFMVHGAQKFGWFGGFGLEATTAFFAKGGLPLAGFVAPAVATLELVGGLLLILGLLTRWAALWFSVEMIITTLLHLVAWGSKYVGGWELDTVLFAASLAVLAHGGGMWSIDEAMRPAVTAPTVKKRK